MPTQIIKMNNHDMSIDPNFETLKVWLVLKIIFKR